MILVFSSTLFAHDGTTIYYRIFFKFNGFCITDIGESWTFDERTSRGLMRIYDIEKNSTLDKNSSIQIGTKIMKGVSVARYFTYIFLDGKDLGKIDATKFKAQTTNNIVSIAFNNHLPNPIDTRKANLSILVEDKTKTLEMKLVEKNPAVLIGAPKKSCKIDIKNKTSNNDISTMEKYSMGMSVLQKVVYISCKD